MRHQSGKFLHEGRWCSREELARLRREAELAEEDARGAQKRLRDYESRCGFSSATLRRVGGDKRRHIYLVALISSISPLRRRSARGDDESIKTKRSRTKWDPRNPGEILVWLRDQIMAIEAGGGRVRYAVIHDRGVERWVFWPQPGRWEIWRETQDPNAIEYVWMESEGEPYWDANPTGLYYPSAYWDPRAAKIYSKRKGGRVLSEQDVLRLTYLHEVRHKEAR